ncbi:DNA recombination protein RmuC [Sulfurimonas sp.]|uniref:DNA recombination protein RmuC n=1 Tax=Sulfurimonas sp. TaxID=2022749 RepID=UPI0025D2FE2D|nr:DNA recombination protein RmuC [Sulfurimonas sp.]
MDIYLILLIASIVIILVLLYLYLITLGYKNNLRLKYAVLSSRYEEEIKSSKEKLEIMQNAKEELSKEFKLLANQIFEDKSKKFNNTHKEQFEILLRPFREQITNFSTQSREQFTHETKERYLLKDELIRLKEMNAQLSQDALNLTTALKGENKTQGNWGEIVLERILEESGLREGIEYKTQSTLKSSEGKIYRPDVIIHMPQDRDIIIDSKVSLVAYERFMSEDNPEAKSLALKEHLNSIHRHIKDLSCKDYDRLQGVNTLDFVLLFMPIEGAFLLALEADGKFFKRAYASNILVVSPSTLLVTLRTIEHIWRTQRQEDHAMKIVDEAEAMYEKLVHFVDEMHKVGSHLQKAQDSYETSIKRLKSGKGNIIKRAENMIELGVKPKKVLNISSEDES